jgi:hypothetical protein
VHCLDVAVEVINEEKVATGTLKQAFWTLTGVGITWLAGRAAQAFVGSEWRIPVVIGVVLVGVPLLVLSKRRRRSGSGLQNGVRKAAGMGVA